MAPFLLGCLLAVAPPTATADPEPAVAEKLSAEELVLLDSLMNQLRSPHEDSRNSVLETFEERAKPYQQTPEQKVADPLLKAAAARLLKILPDKRESIETRATATIACWHVVPSQELLPYLIPLMKDKDPRIREAATMATGAVLQS